MTIATEALQSGLAPSPPGTPEPGNDLFDPVIRAVMLCDGIGREKTIALVLSAVESAFPS